MCCGQVPVDSIHPTSSLRQLSSASFLPSAYANSVGRLDVTANGARPRDALPVSVAACAERERHRIRFIKPLHIPGATNAPPPGEYGASRLALTYSTTKCSHYRFHHRACACCHPRTKAILVFPTVTFCTVPFSGHVGVGAVGAVGAPHTSMHHIHASTQTNRN